MPKPRPCGKCPKYNQRSQICAIRAQYMTPDHPSCDFGRWAMDNAYVTEYVRKRRGSKKRPVPPEPTPADYDRLNTTPCPRRRRRTRKLKGVKVLAK